MLILVPLNDNGYVRAKLTDAGMRAIAAAQAPHAIELKDGWWRVQVWEFLRVLGPHCGWGVPIKFTELAFEVEETTNA